MNEVVNQTAAEPAAAPSNGVGAIRLNNIQRIQLRKQQVREWPRPKKMEKLSVYSSCKACLIAFKGNNMT